MAFVSEISAKLSADTSEFSSGMAKAADDGGKYAGKLAEKVADKVFGLRDVAHVVATALGLNLENIAEHIAGFFTGMSKEIVEAMNKAQEASDRAASMAIDNMRAALSEEKKYTLALQDRDRIQNQLMAATEKMGQALALEAKYSDNQIVAAKFRKEYNEAFIKQQELSLQLQEKQGEVVKLEIKARDELNKRNEESWKAGVDVTEKNLKLQLDELHGAEKINALKLNIADLEAFISQSKLDQKQLDVFTGVLQERKNALVAEEAAQRKQIAEIDKKNTDALIEGQRKEADAKRDALPVDEQIAKLKKEIAGWEQAATYQAKEHLDATDSLRRAEELRGKLREVQSKNLKEDAISQEEFLKRQADIQEILSKGVGNLTDGDKERLVTLAGQNSILQEQIKIVDDLTRQFENFTATITHVGSAYEDQSTTALMGTLARLKAKLDPRGTVLGASSTSNNDIYGAYLTNQAVGPEIRAIEALLKRRAEIQGYEARYGEDQTRFRYGDDATDKAMRDLSDAQTRASNTLDEINRRLAGSSLFPKL